MVRLDPWGTCLKNVATHVDDGVACIVLHWKHVSWSRCLAASSSTAGYRVVGKRKGHRCDAARVVEPVPSRGVLLAISCMGTPRCRHGPQEGEGDV
jgi:hypothetical protein